MSGKVGVDYVQTFAVRTGSGAPRTGLVAGDFTATVRNPGDTASSSPAVSEVGGGMYRFTIPNAFTTANGVGEYGWTVEVTSAPFDIGAGTVEFLLANLDDLETDAAAAAREVVNIAEHDATQVSILTRAAPGDAMALTPAERTATAGAILTLDISTLEPSAARNLLRAVQKLVNRIENTGALLNVYRIDDATVDWAQATTVSAGAAPIIELDTV